MIPVNVGDRIWFAEERIGYTVQAVSSDRRWAVCTKPMPLHDTVLYTVVDFTEYERGTDNIVGSLGYQDREDCEQAARMFESGDAEFSHRRQPIELKIKRWQAEP